MKVSHRWLEDERVCLVRYEGEMDGDAFIEADREIFSSRTGPGLRYFFDLRSVHIRGGAESCRRYATWLSELEFDATHPGSQQVMVVDDPQDTGLTMLMAAISSPELQIQIYSTLEQACRDLGVDPSILEDHRDLIPV